MKSVLIGLIEGYKRFVSPMLPSSCRYIPTCSEYACQAITKYGAAKGALLAAHRVLRCNPFSHGGFDPVPDEWPYGKRHTNVSEDKTDI